MQPYENNVFVRPPDGYKRDLDIKNNAKELAAEYLHLQTKEPYDKCLAFVNKQTEDSSKYPLVPVQLKVLKRNDVGDREKAVVNIDEVLNYAISTESIIAPNMVVYDNSKTNISLSASYLIGNLAKRSIIKKKGMIAKQVKDENTYLICHNTEYGIKIFNNSVSGARVSPHNPFFFRVIHSSLTSNTRMMVSYSNASTERFICGNRHYFSIDVIIENILGIIHNTNYSQLSEVISKYNLYIPTTKDIFDLIKRSAKFYIYKMCNFDLAKSLIDIEDVKYKRLYNLVNNLSDLQKAIFVYNGDLFHLAKYNDKLIRDLITEYITSPLPNNDIYHSEDPDKIIGDAHSGTTAFAGILCSHILAGETIDKVKKESPTNYKIYSDTVKHIVQLDNKYKDLYICLFANDSPPSAIFNFPSSIRRSVVGSDTDSTMFTVQEWIKWYFGKLIFGDEASKVSNVLCYLNTRLIAHWLAYVSKQMGVEEHNLYELEMKNEFSFKIYARANMAKHYATLIDAREGNVYKEFELELKGVNLKNSKIVLAIMSKLKLLITDTLIDITNNKGIYIYPILQQIANLEHTIFKSLSNGEITFLSAVNISDKMAYKKPMSSNYVHYDLYINVFQKKYGEIEPPPYKAIKLVTNLNKPKLVNDWVQSLDESLFNDFQLWLNKFNDINEDDFKDIVSVDEETGEITTIMEIINPKKSLKMLLLPQSIFENGLPSEFVNILDQRKIVSELLNGFYIFLTMIGYYIKDKNNSVLLSDTIIYRE